MAIIKEGKRAFWLVFTFLILTMGAWLVSSLGYRHFGRGPLVGTGSFFGALGYSLLAFSLFLSTRWPKLEEIFGALDHIYHLHRKLGIGGFIALLAHPIFFSLRHLSQGFEGLFLTFLPFHGRFSVNLGVYSFWLMVLILGLTFVKLLPYEKWKNLHKFMSLVFILATLHFLLSRRIFGPPYVIKSILTLPMSLGLVSIYYKQVYKRYLVRYPRYALKKIEKLDQLHLQLTLEPLEKTLKFHSGQYGFFTFSSKKIAPESHPFTLCKAEKSNCLMTLIKTRGDYTESLYSHLREGDECSIEGPFGRFDYKKGKSKQIWIAGGIGIAPFLTWAREILRDKEKALEIHLFYSVHDESNRVFWKEFEQIENSVPNFHFYPLCSKKSGRLDAVKISEIVNVSKEFSILLCGPEQMTKDLSCQLLSRGVQKSDIIFEDFTFF